MIRVLALALVAACSVPSVDLSDKACPCVSGYVCDVLAMKCRRAGDAGGSTSCLGSDPGASLYTDGFDAATLDTGWVITSMWAQSSGQLVQSDTNDQLAFAYTTRVTQADYRVIAHGTGTAGGTGMGITVRAASGTKAQYDCLWEPGASAGTDGVLLWQVTNNGGAATTLQSKVGVPSGGADARVTMEASAAGGQLSCCLDGVEGASVQVTNPAPLYQTGQPGLVTDRMRASFDDFGVFAN